MPTIWHSFKLRPLNFFSQKPGDRSADQLRDPVLTGAGGRAG